jgi:hypothetical protein
VSYAGVRMAAPVLDPNTPQLRRATRTQAVVAVAQKSPQVLAAPKVTIRPTEYYWRNLGSHRATMMHPKGQTPEPHAEVNYVGLKIVPRLFKRGTAGWASPASPGWPPSASAGYYTTLKTQHIRPQTLPRSSERATGTAATFKGGVNRSRIPPILVPRPRVAR